MGEKIKGAKSEFGAVEEEVEVYRSPAFFLC
jgi:hypothetical protein